MNGNKSLIAGSFLLGLSGLLVIALTLGQRSVERKIRVGLNEQIASYADSATITYRSVKVSFLFGKVSINGIEFTPLQKNPKRLALKIDRLQFSELDFGSIAHLVKKSNEPILPKSLRVGLMGMHFTPELLGEKAGKALAEYHYDEMALSLALGLKFDREAKTVRIDDLGLEIADLGKLSTTWDFAQVSLPSEEQLKDPEAMKALARDWKNITLHYADLKYTDLGFFKRYDQVNAAKGQPTLAMSADMMSKAMGRTPAKLNFLNEAVPKIQDFLIHGGTIALKAQPAKDPTLVELANPLALLDPNAFATKIGLSLEVTH
jgi:hypothetical protein